MLIKHMYATSGVDALGGLWLDIEGYCSITGDINLVCCKRLSRVKMWNGMRPSKCFFWRLDQSFLEKCAKSFFSPPCLRRKPQFGNPSTIFHFLYHPYPILLSDNI